MWIAVSMMMWIAVSLILVMLILIWLTLLGIWGEMSRQTQRSHEDESL